MRCAFDDCSSCGSGRLSEYNDDDDDDDDDDAKDGEEDEERVGVRESARVRSCALTRAVNVVVVEESTNACSDGLGGEADGACDAEADRDVCMPWRFNGVRNEVDDDAEDDDAVEVGAYKSGQMMTSSRISCVSVWK